MINPVGDNAVEYRGKKRVLRKNHSIEIPKQTPISAADEELGQVQPPFFSSRPFPLATRHDMPTKVLPFFLTMVFVLGSAHVFPAAAADVEAQKKVVVAVEGLVSCQDCGSVGTWNLAGAKPLPSARVSITCRDHRNRVVLYKSAAADDNGYVFVELYTTTMRGGYFDPVEACGVRLLVSSDIRCDRPTDVNNGVRGAQLRYENTTISGQYADIDVYVAGPLAFMPAQCPPKTTRS